MLTGDNEASAQRIARKLGIRNVSAALRWAEALAGSSCLLGRAETNSCARGGPSPSSSWQSVLAACLLACLLNAHPLN